MSDAAHLERTVELARLERPHPNPRVGAVVVDPDGVTIGEGSHQGVGFPHAEVIALEAAGEHARHATLYVSLEPCNHTGRTPPCVDAILRAGVGRVVIGATDPNPAVAGGGAAMLRAAGLEVLVDTTVSGQAADPGYFHFHLTGRSRVTLKSALTLDGSVAGLDGSSQWISSAESRADAHRLRSESDAVMIGAGTVRTDDPRLDVRLPRFRGPQPRPVIVVGKRPLPAAAAVLERDPVIASADQDGRVDLESLLQRLGSDGMYDVLVEGGPTLARSLWEHDLVDRGVFYLAAKVAGGIGRPVLDGPFATLGDARDVTIVAIDRLGGDVRLEFDVHRDR